MSQKDLNAGMGKDLPDYLRNMRFKPVQVDKENLYSEILYRIQRSDTARKGVSIVWKYVSIAASAVLFIMTSYLIMHNKGESVEPQFAYMEVSSVAGSKTRLLLPDSSIVWLNGASTIRYPQMFTENVRMVALTGEAMFEVRKNEDMPFIVNIDDMQVKVLGTVFNLYTNPNSRIIETTLLEGLVELYSGHKAEPLCRLTPNQQAMYNNENGELKVSEVNAATYYSWITGHFNFERTSLEQIAIQLERAFDVKIHIKEDLRNIQFNAQFSHQESLEEILSILQIPACYNYKKEKGEIYIY